MDHLCEQFPVETAMRLLLREIKLLAFDILHVYQLFRNI